MGDDREFIDLDSTQNWSQLDVKRELDNLEVDAETGKRYDFARGFSDDLKEKEDAVILDGLTSGLNYIPEEFLMAADEKREADIEKKPEEERPDVSWAYRNESDNAPDDEPFVALADIKKAEAEAAGLLAKEVAAAQKEAQEAAEEAERLAAKAKAAEIEAIRAKNLEQQAKKIAEANASDEIVKANIEERKRIREELAAQNEAKIRERAEARKEAQRQAEIEMYSNNADDAFSNQILDLDDLDIPVVSKEERIAAANKNGHNVTEEIKVEAVKEAETKEETEGEILPVVNYELDEAEKQALSTGDTGVIYYDDDGEPINAEEAKVESKVVSDEPTEGGRFAGVGTVSEEYAAWADADDEEEVPVPKKKKRKKKKKPVVVEEEIADEDEEEEIYGGFFEKVAGFFKHMSGLDILVMCTGILVVVVGIITISVYSASRATQAKIDEFAYLGEKMQVIGMNGSSKLVAVADAKKALAEMELEVPEEEVVEEPVEYVEKEEEKTVSVTMTLTSVKKDLKIKFLNAKTKKLVGNYEFQVSIEDAKGKKYTATDDDKDGIIYLNSVEPGKAKVAMVELKDAKDLKFSTETVTVTVKENIDYKKIDVSDEVKTESEINAKKEDTAAGIATEGTLTDTVEWVESTKKLKDDVKMQKIGASKLDNLPGKVTPTPAAGAFRNFSSMFRRFADLWVLKVHAEHSEHVWDGGTTTKEASCTEEGVTTYKCTLEECQETKTEPITKKGHQYGDDGKCKECGAEDPNKTPEPQPSPSPSPEANPSPSPDAQPSPSPAACEHSYKDNVVAEATCKEAGKKNQKCEKCGEIKEGSEVAIDKKAHEFGTDGKCKVCGEVNKDSTTALLYKGKPVYIDAEGTKPATYADYYAGTKEFYYKPEASDMGGDDSLYIYTGWQTLKGNTYFFDKNGNYVTGEQVIQGAKYNFDSTGALMKGSGSMGIDVSKWNGNINWTAVKNSGVSFVIIRCGYRGSSTGALVEDPKFRTNIKGATDAGLKVGVYFFSQAISDVEAVEEASMAINLMKGYKVSYPVFLDVEDSGGRGDRIDANTRTQVIKAFCETIKNSGYTPGVYANKSWLNTKMNVGSLGNYKIWLAQYNTEPTYTGRFDMWQYSDKGSVGGIGGRTDMNLSYLGY